MGRMRVSEMGMVFDARSGRRTHRGGWVEGLGQWRWWVSWELREPIAGALSQRKKGGVCHRGGLDGISPSSFVVPVREREKNRCKRENRRGEESRERQEMRLKSEDENERRVFGVYTFVRKESGPNISDPSYSTEAHKDP